MTILLCWLGINAIIPALAVPPAISPTVTRDSHRLDALLQRVNLRQQMLAWQGRLLIIQLKPSATPPALVYYDFPPGAGAIAQSAIVSAPRPPAAAVSSPVFAPASTIKVAIAALALEKLNQYGMNRTASYRQLAASGMPGPWFAIADDLRRSLVISDNAAANRLLLFVGLTHFNQRMRELGIAGFWMNRLFLNVGTLVPSPALELRLGDRRITHPPQAVTPDFICYETPTQIGNCATAEGLLAVLLRIIQPNYFRPESQFKMTVGDRQWLQQLLAHTPKQAGFPYPDHYCRFLTDVAKQFASGTGRMLSKCGVALFSHSYIDTSMIETQTGEQYYIVISLSPPKSVSEPQVRRWMNRVVGLVLSQLR